MEEDTCCRDRGQYRQNITGLKEESNMWVIQDIATQYIFGIVFCIILFFIWKITNKGEKL